MWDPSGVPIVPFAVDHPYETAYKILQSFGVVFDVERWFPRGLNGAVLIWKAQLPSLSIPLVPSCLDSGGDQECILLAELES